MTKVNNQSKHSERPLASTEEGASGIAGPENPSQPIAASGIAAEIEEEGYEENAEGISELREGRPGPRKQWFWRMIFTMLTTEIGASR